MPHCARYRRAVSPVPNGIARGTKVSITKNNRHESTMTMIARHHDNPYSILNSRLYLRLLNIQSRTKNTKSVITPTTTNPKKTYKPYPRRKGSTYPSITFPKIQSSTSLIRSLLPPKLPSTTINPNKTKGMTKIQMLQQPKNGVPLLDSLSPEIQNIPYPPSHFFGHSSM